VQWHGVLKDEAILVPAGTIHAIGAGLVVAEIQQRSDTTFRLFDHGRQRQLHVDSAVAAATAGPAAHQSAPRRLSDARTLLVSSPYFVLERIDLPPQSSWELDAVCETWLLVLKGRARVGMVNAFVGEAIFLDADRTGLKAGPDGLKGLLAYLGSEPRARLLQPHHGHDAGRPDRHRLPPPVQRAASSLPIGTMEARQ